MLGCALHFLSLISCSNSLFAWVIWRLSDYVFGAGCLIGFRPLRANVIFLC